MAQAHKNARMLKREIKRLRRLAARFTGSDGRYWAILRQVDFLESEMARVCA